MQIDQLFEFVYILIDKKQVTAKEMAGRFGVSTRTIYRWMEALSVSGVPVYSLTGRGGGIAISEKYALDKTVLTEEEKLAIVSSVKALNALTPSMTTANSRQPTLEKLSSLSNADTDWIEVDFDPWSSEGSEVSQIFGTLREGILKKKQLTFDYYSGDGKIEKRTVHPWKLVYKGQAWYLRGWCTLRKAERFFKLTRMRKVQLTARKADITKEVTGKSETEKAAYQKQNEPLLSIKAKVMSSKIPYLLDTFICTEIEPQKDGSVIAAFSVPDVEWIYEMLLSFGPSMKIISPAAVQQKVIDLANDMLQNYK